MEIDNYSDIPRNPKELVELLAIVHLGIAANGDNRISSGSSAVYMGSEAAFKNTILFAYPRLSNERIYEIWLDCNESIAHCVSEVEKEIAAENERKRIEPLEDAAYEKGYDLGEKNARLFYLENISDTPVVPEELSEVRADFLGAYKEGWRAYEQYCQRALEESE